MPRDLRSALTEEIVQMLAVGAAPTLPQAQPASGRVRGTIVYEGQPLAGASLQICGLRYRGSMARATGYSTPSDAPDPAAPFVAGSRTARDGTFQLWQVPAEPFFITVRRPNGIWWVSRTSPCCARARRGQEYDMGTVDVPVR